VRFLLIFVLCTGLANHVDAWELGKNKDGEYTATTLSTKNNNTFFQIVFVTGRQCHIIARYGKVTGEPGVDEDIVPLNLRIDSLARYSVEGFGSGETAGRSVLFSLTNSEPQLLFDIFAGKILRIKVGHPVDAVYDSFLLTNSGKVIMQASQKCQLQIADSEREFF